MGNQRSETPKGAGEEFWKEVASKDENVSVMESASQAEGTAWESKEDSGWIVEVGIRFAPLGASPRGFAWSPSWFDQSCEVRR